VSSSCLAVPDPAASSVAGSRGSSSSTKSARQAAAPPGHAACQRPEAAGGSEGTRTHGHRVSPVEKASSEKRDTELPAPRHNLSIAALKNAGKSQPIQHFGSHTYDAEVVRPCAAMEARRSCAWPSAPGP
jgi:hypothetical protein